MKKNIKVALYTDDDELLDFGEDLEMSEEALSNFKFALSDVEAEIELDLETGDYKIIEIIDKTNTEEVKLHIIP